MPSLDATSIKSANKIFRENLARNIILLLIFISLFPLAVIGGTTYFRTRQILFTQASNQLQTIIQNQTQQLQLISIPNQKALSDLAVQGGLEGKLLDIVKQPHNITIRKEIQEEYFQKYLSKSSTSTLSVFDQMWGITQDGKVIISSEDEWIGEDLMQVYAFQTLNGTNHDLIAYNPEPLYTDEIVVFSARVIKDPDGTPFLTIIGATRSPTPLTTLAATNSFFDSSNTYLFTDNKQIVGVTQTGQQLYELNPDPSHLKKLQSFGQDSPDTSVFADKENTSYLVYAKWIPDLRVGLALEVPQNEIYKEFFDLISFNLTVLVITVAAAVFVIIVSARRVTLPLRQLTEQAKNLTEGNWSTRTEVKRHDEIGLLGYTFNAMAEQLSDLYHSLEQKVEARTNQLQTATDIIHLATSSTEREEINQKTVDLVVERFEYLYAAFFTINETNHTVTLSNEAGDIPKEQSSLGIHYRINTETLVGQAALNNQAIHQGINNVEDSTWLSALPEATFEAAIPIAIGSQILGVLYLQAAEENKFDEETIAVLQTLANQIASGLQKIELLETTEVDLEETALLYRTSLKITQSKDKEELLESLKEGLKETTILKSIFVIEDDEIKMIMAPESQESQYKVSFGPFTVSKNLTDLLCAKEYFLFEDATIPINLGRFITPLAQSNCHAFIMLPILVSGKPAIVLSLGAQSAAEFSETKLQPFFNLVQQTSNTLNQIEISNSLEKRLLELQTVSNISQLIASEVDLNQLYLTLHQQIRNSLGSDLIFTIAIYNEEHRQIEIPFLYNDSTITSLAPIPLGEGLTSHIIQTKESLLLVNDVEDRAKELGAKIMGKPAKSWLGAPLMAGGEVIGVLILQDNIHENRFSQDDLNFVSTLAAQAGAAIHNAELVNNLKGAIQNYDQERYLLNTLLENIPELVYFKDRKGKYLRVSQSMTNHFPDTTPDMFVGKSDLELFGETENNSLDDQEILLTGEKELNQLNKKVFPNGIEKWYQTSRIPLYDAEKVPFGTFGISRDISELKTAEEKAQARAQQLQIAAEIARDTTGTLNLDEFLAKSINMIREKFGFYHSSIFIIDPLGEYAVLKESTGEAGEQLKRTKHRLAVGSHSLVGQVTKDNKPLVINNVLEDPNYYSNPFLPETQSELVIPLNVGNHILGALDVQSTVKNAFSKDDVEILQIVADQLAAAIISANLFTGTQKNLSLQRSLQKLTTSITTCNTAEEVYATTISGLKETLPEDQIALFIMNNHHKLEIRGFAGYEGKGTLKSTYDLGEGIIGTVAEEKQSMLINDALANESYQELNKEIRSVLALPIIYKEDLLGVLSIVNEKIGAYGESDQEILGTWVNNIGSVLSNTELLSRIHQQVDNQKAINEITNTIRRSVDLRSILEVSTSEICKALGAKRARIQIDPTLSKEINPPLDFLNEAKEEIQ